MLVFTISVVLYLIVQIYLFYVIFKSLEILNRTQRSIINMMIINDIIRVLQQKKGKKGKEEEEEERDV